MIYIMRSSENAVALNYGFIYAYPACCLLISSRTPTGTTFTKGKTSSLEIFIPINALLHAANATPSWDKIFSLSLKSLLYIAFYCF